MKNYTNIPSTSRMYHLLNGTMHFRQPFMRWSCYLANSPTAPFKYVFFDNHSRWLSTAAQNETSPLIDHIIRGKTLSTKSKKLFRIYWDTMLNNSESTNKPTLLKKLPIEVLSQFLQKYRHSSSTIRGAYRRELLFNYNQNPENIKKLMSNLDISSKNNLNLENLLELIIEDCLRTKDVTIAVDLYILYYKLFPKETLDKRICSNIISALAFENPRYDHIHLLKYLQLHKLFESYGTHISLTDTQITTLCNKALALENSPILTKETLKRLMNIEESPAENIRKKKMISAYYLIQNDYKINNPAGVLFTWSNIKNDYISVAHHDPRIIHRVLKIFTHNKAYRKHFKELLSQLQPEFYCNNSLILPSIIDYATKTNNLLLAQTIMNNVNTCILQENTQIVLFSKRCLSSLLRMHLKFNDSEGVDRVLKQILEIFGKHSEENLFAIISQLISVKTLENLNKAIQLVNSIPQKRALLSYGAIINKIIEWQIASSGKFDTKSMPLIHEMLMKAHNQDPTHRNSLWTIVASLFIKKTVHYKTFQTQAVNDNNGGKKAINSICLDLAKSIYINSDVKGLNSQMTDINPFMNPSPENILLRITNNNRIIILRNIALSAIKAKRKDIFLWCCSELYQKGISVNELRLDWNMGLNNVLRSAKAWNYKQLEQTINEKGLPMISKALK